MLFTAEVQNFGMKMESSSIRLFKESDIEFAYEMTKIEGWNYPKEDIQRMFSYNPSSCFVAEVDGKRVGHVFSVKYGRLGWIGLLIVRAEYRKKGIGTLLMKEVMNHLLSGGVETVKLEAVSAIATIYRKLGFVDEYDSLRFLGVGRKIDSAANLNVKLLKKETVKKIAEFDAEYFGANRIKVLSSLCNDNPKLCFVSYAGSKLVGYIMCRRAEKGYRIGPWVCSPENPTVVKELLMKCVEAMGENVKLYVGVLAVNKKAVEILLDFGFEQYSRSIRMYFGKKLETECASGIFGIGGPEKG
jgi:ribosomal protein S18 acetylase RimI-like enzyme